MNRAIRQEIIDFGNDQYQYWLGVSGGQNTNSQSFIDENKRRRDLMQTVEFGNDGVYMPMALSQAVNKYGFEKVAKDFYNASLTVPTGGNAGQRRVNNRYRVVYAMIAKNAAEKTIPTDYDVIINTSQFLPRESVTAQLPEEKGSNSTGYSNETSLFGLKLTQNQKILGITSLLLILASQFKKISL